MEAFADNDSHPEWRHALEEIAQHREREEYIYQEIQAERWAQDVKWGGPVHDDGHDPADWISYLAKHLGRAVIWPFDPAKYRVQLLRVAALAVAAIAALDRYQEARKEAHKRMGLSE